MGKKKKKLPMTIIAYLVTAGLLLFAIAYFFDLINYFTIVSTQYNISFNGPGSPNVFYGMNMEFKSEGSFIAGKPVDVKVEIFYSDNNSPKLQSEWEDVMMSIGGRQCFRFREKERVKYGEYELGRPNVMAELTNSLKYPTLFTFSGRYVFEEPGDQPIFEYVLIDKDVKSKGIRINNSSTPGQFDRTIYIEPRSTWISVLQNRIGVAIGLIALAFTIFQVLKDLIK